MIRIDTFLRAAVFGRHKTNNGFRTVRASRCLYSNTCKAIKQPSEVRTHCHALINQSARSYLMISGPRPLLMVQL